jgi:4-deoxy-L-threo-5-hexosulose-uronate ketol-isomerase
MSQIRFGSHPDDVKRFTTEELRERFLIKDLFKQGECVAVYSMHDRMVTMGVVPGSEALKLPVYEDLTKSTYFLERRELGVINIGKPGVVTVDDEKFTLANKECLYVGQGKREITFESSSASEPAEFYINSSPAHHSYPTAKAGLTDAKEVNLGSKENCNERTIYQYIHENGIQSCQLVMGFTQLHTGSIWNTFPPHTHYRRMEVYCYFDMQEDQILMHFMGEPDETRHLVMRNKEAVISPEWSIHSGAGTASYAFIWGMAGENKAFTDMDGAKLAEIK